MLSEFFRFLQTGLMCGTVLAIAFMVALSLPKSRLRTVVTEICSWAALGLCAFYAVSPVDIVPEAVFGPVGLIDDIGAVFFGWQAYKSAIQCREERKAFE